MVADWVALEGAGAKKMTAAVMKTSERKIIRVFTFKFSCLSLRFQIPDPRSQIPDSQIPRFPDSQISDS